MFFDLKQQHFFVVICHICVRKRHRKISMAVIDAQKAFCYNIFRNLKDRKTISMERASAHRGQPSRRDQFDKKGMMLK